MLALGRDIEIAKRIARLRRQIPQYIDNMCEISDKDSPARTYFMKAFPRWIFNCISIGKNPFVVPITAAELLSSQDFDYFYSKHPEYVQRDIDWTWLDQRLSQLLICDNIQPVVLARTLLETSVVFECSAYRPVVMTRQQYTSCLARYANRMYSYEEVDVAIYTILLRYHCIGVNNNHCSVPPNVIRYAKAHTELFGTPFNTTLDQYCSPFSDLESQFGSVGSFFDFAFPSGTYLMNPPYDEELMHEAMRVAMQALETKPEITIIVVIPDWSAEQQQADYGEVYFDREFRAKHALLSSPYLRSHVILTKQEHKFYDYFTDTYIGICDVYLAILSNTTYQLTAVELANYWKTSC